MTIISVMAYYTGILSGIIGGIMAYYLSVLGKLSLELTILAVVLASFSLFLMAHQYFKENGSSYSLIDYRHSKENENDNPIAPSAE